MARAPRRRKSVSLRRGVERVVVTVRQHDGAGRRGGTSQRYEGSRVPSRVPCTNPRCRRGGYALRPFLSSMVAGQVSEQTWSAACRGRATDDLGRAAPCGRFADVTVRIVYAGA